MASISRAAAGAVRGKRSVLYLMRNDLRLHDSECWNYACSNFDRVLPVYCFDPNHYGKTHRYGFRKTGPHRAKFLLECVADMRASLRGLGSDLLITQKKETHAAVAELLDAYGPSAVIMHRDVCKEEVDVEDMVAQECDRRGVAFKRFWGSTLIHRNDLPFRVAQLPNTFTEFRKACERGRGLDDLVWDCYNAPTALPPLPEGVDATSPLPTLHDLGVDASEISDDTKTAFPFKGGENAALQRVADYTFGTHAVKTYKETRNGLLGADYSTKFSPWLATGSLSPRKIFWSIKEFESQVVANKSTYWVIFELMWRDYFKFVCLKFGSSVFHRSGIMNKKNKASRWKEDAKALERWRMGTTGVPFVDANMRELHRSGWMSNRGRQNCASFLVHNLGIDWRMGAEWFESMLLDHDVCSNYGNWNYAAGVGNDPREGRRFNIIKQAHDYDKNAEFVSAWIPELADVPQEHRHTPWNSPTPPADYPKPMVMDRSWQKHSGRGGNKQRERGAANRSKGKNKPRNNRKAKKKGSNFYSKPSPSVPVHAQ